MERLKKGKKGERDDSIRVGDEGHGKGTPVRGDRVRGVFGRDFIG